MPLPLAHGLLGATAAAAALPRETPPRDFKRALLVAASLGVLPDFDYALNLFHALGGGWHHGFTHSLVFALFAGLFAAALSRERRRAFVLAFVLAALSHTLLDLLLTESLGVELFWPFSSRRFRLNFPNPIDYSWSQTSLRAAAPDVLKVCALEFALFAPPLAAVLAFRRARRRAG
jgi:membrane-bound metal-dependent hydrolase YbcI (DUF457 family)